MENKKLLRVADVRKRMDAHYRDEISYSKAVELLNEDANKALNIAIVSHSKVEKPPLGLKPKWIHDQQRQGEIMAAIARYLEVGKTPPKEWAIEFASYCG